MFFQGNGTENTINTHFEQLEVPAQFTGVHILP